MSRNVLRRCTKCTHPETHETIHFDDEGVCNICRATEYKQSGIDWAARKLELDSIVDSYRDQGEYDCLIPFSGGKDSTWTLYYMVKEYGLRPLVIRFDHSFLRPQVLENSIRTFRKLGVDSLQFTPSWKVVQKLMLQSLMEKGDFCWHCHTGIFSYPMWVAIRYRIPLIIWGEPSTEYTAYYHQDQKEEVDEKRFNRYVNLGITAEDMHVRLGGAVSERELRPFSYPPLSELRKLGYRSICLGSYIAWDPKEQSRIIGEELGWEGALVENVPPEYNYEKIECQMQGIRDYIKFIKRGYSRPTHLVSLDIRNHRKDRYQALRLVEQYEGKRPPSLDRFLDYVGLTEAEFLEIAMQHQVSPYQHDPAATEPGQPVPDMDQWQTHEKMPREDAEQLLTRWKERTHTFEDAR